MSILQNHACPKMFGALTALALGPSLAATGSASAQKFYNAAMAAPNGAEVLTGFPHSYSHYAASDRCAATNGGEILGGFKSAEMVVCHR